MPSSHGVLLALLMGAFVLSIVQYSIPEGDLPSFLSMTDFVSSSSTSSSFEKPFEQTPRTPPDDIFKERKNLPPYHVVFSTSCSEQQNWESMLFFYHAWKVRQPGNITRIASGCNPNEAKELIQFHNEYIQPMSDSFHLHLTPDFSRLHLAEGKFPYKYMNKPYGLRHWMEYGPLGLSVNTTAPADVLDGIVLLLDPDMVLLRPLVHDFRQEDVIWVEGENVPADRRVVRHGNPIAQQDGYLTNEWMSLQVDGIQRPEWKEGPIHWNSGPPYLFTVKDAYAIAVRWTELAPKVLQVYPKLFAEMYGLIFATVDLKLPFTFIKSIVVSTTETKDREGWQYIDDLPNEQLCNLAPTARLPIGLHYCKRYMLGRWFFSKYRVKKNIMNCDKHLFKKPPSDLYPSLDYWVQPPKADLSDISVERQPVKMSERQAKREQFMLCQMVDAMNEALRYHKKRACKDGNASFSELYTIHDDPSNY